MGGHHGSITCRALGSCALLLFLVFNPLFLCVFYTHTKKSSAGPLFYFMSLFSPLLYLHTLCAHRTTDCCFSVMHSGYLSHPVYTHPMRLNIFTVYGKEGKERGGCHRTGATLPSWCMCVCVCAHTRMCVHPKDQRREGASLYWAGLVERHLVVCCAL